jgi:hypothetical protein
VNGWVQKTGFPEETKVKLFLCLTKQCSRGSGYVEPRLLDLDTDWRWVVSFTPSRFISGERPPPLIPICYETELQNLHGRHEGRKMPLPGLELNSSPLQTIAGRYADCTMRAVVKIQSLLEIRTCFVPNKSASLPEPTCPLCPGCYLVPFALKVSKPHSDNLCTWKRSSPFTFRFMPPCRSHLLPTAVVTFQTGCVLFCVCFLT